MKRILLPLLCIVIYTISYGASVSEINLLPRNKTIEEKIPHNELSKISNRKLIFFERLVAKMLRIKMRKGFAGNGAIKKDISEKLFRSDRSKPRFHAGGFILGLLLGPVGVLISYLFKDEHKRRRIKWSWIGFSAWIVIIVFIAFYQRPIID